MYHISVNIAIGRRKKIFGGTKSSRGRQKDYKRRKKISTFFFFSFVFYYGAKKSPGAPNCNVTPLDMATCMDVT